MISRESIEEVKERANILEIIGEVVSLKRSGSNYSGLCPFHSEKSPSFHVREDNKFYHCFGCGASGNVFTFLMQTRGITFPESVESLAARYGVELKRDKEVKEFRSNKSNLLKINRMAQSYFVEKLKSAPEQVTRYLAERGLAAHALHRFGVGFCPDDWHGLTDFFKIKKAPIDLLIATGLLRRNSKGDLYDGYRGRLIFPIQSDKDTIIGFGGRIIPTLSSAEQLKSAPKYINSPETEIYKKNRVLYGYPQAVTAIKESGFLYMVEGYMDVIGLAQAGVENVVATCGTAVTENHIKRISSVTKRVIVVFDGDSAGRSAAAKTFPLFLNSGLDVRVLLLPQDEDPDTIAQRYKDKTSEYLEKLEKMTLFSCYITSLIAAYGETEADKLGAALRGRIGSKVAEILSQVTNPIERGLLMEEAKALLHVGEEIGSFEGVRAGTKPIVASTDVPIRTGFIQVEALPRLDRDILTVVMAKREMLDQVLRDAAIASELHPDSIHFLMQFDAILRAEGAEGPKKEQLKRLFFEMGESWRKHYMQAHEMQNDPRVKLERTLLECGLRVKKNQLNRILTDVEERMNAYPDQDTKLRLIEESVSIRRKIQELSI